MLYVIIFHFYFVVIVCLFVCYNFLQLQHIDPSALTLMCSVLLKTPQASLRCHQECVNYDALFYTPTAALLCPPD